MSNHVGEYDFEKFDMEEYGRGKRPHPAVNYHETEEDCRRLRAGDKAFELKRMRDRLRITFEVDKLRAEKTQLEAEKVRWESHIKRLKQRNKRLIASMAICLVYAVVVAAIFLSWVLLGRGHFQG